MSHDPTFDFEARCAELAEQLRIANARHQAALRDVQRAQTTTRMIRKLYRMEYMELPTVDLAGVFLDLVIESLAVDCAAVLRKATGGDEKFEVLEARGFARGGRRSLPVTAEQPEFLFVADDDEGSEFAGLLRRLAGTRSVLWCRGADASMALLLGNGRSDQAPGWRFDADDRHMAAAALEVFASVVERNRIEQKLAFDACHDELTELPNRHSISQVLEARLPDQSGKNEFAVLCVDIDRFKLINDSLGRVVGDDLIRLFARRLRETVRPGDEVARLNGDEFVVLAEDISAGEGAEQMAQRIVESFRRPFRVHDHSVYVSASIGIAHGPDGYESVTELLRDADIALYNAKRRGGGRVRRFGTDMHNAMLSRVQLEAELREALGRDQLRLYYQPIYSLTDRSLHGFEALLRWQHPTAGLVTPAKFLHLIEETGLGVSIGDWVLEQAAADLSEWSVDASKDHGVSVSINVSEGQFLQADFVDKVAAVIRRRNIRPELLCLELTERMLLESEFIEGDILNRIREMDISVAVDDFGTGYSSLGRLQKLPIDTLKIDRSFVDEIAEKADHKAIVRTIVALARNLNMKIVAEGAETESQLRILEELGCDYVQGYLTGGPMSSMEVAALLATGSPLPA